MVTLSEDTVSKLMALRHCEDEQIDRVVRRLIRKGSAEGATEQTETDTNDQKCMLNAIQSLNSSPAKSRHNLTDATTDLQNSYLSRSSEKRAPRHAIEILGEEYGAFSLAEVFAAAVDKVATLTPEVLENLSKQRIRSRYYLSRSADGVHPNRSDLRVHRTRSGWWVSANVSLQQSKAHLRALCEHSGLTYGKDIKLIR